VELEFEDVDFVEGGKLENPEKNPQSKARTNNKLNPHNYSTGQESNPGHIGGWKALSPLWHPCSPKKKILPNLHEDPATNL